jgi:aminopeptidase N
MPVGSTELRPHRLHVGLFDIAGDKLTRRTSVELDVAGELTQVSALAGEKVADLVLINDKDQTYAKLRFDERSIATMKSHLGGLDDSLARGLIWASLWDSCRDGELSATDYVAIALSALKSESDISIVSATLMQIDTAIWAYANPTKREALRAQVGESVEALLDASAPGSDHQMAFARAFANFAFSPTHFDRIKAILDGSINGLVIDADIRWYIFISGVKRGVFGPVEIESESKRDETAHGKQYTASAYAAIPTKEAKAKAFQSITTDNLSNTIHSYTCQGFNLNIHNDILADFVDPYFDSMLKVWETKGYEIAETTATLLFPTWVITPETLAKAEHWLNVTGKDASHALRRAITEGRDAMARAIKAQAADK